MEERKTRTQRTAWAVLGVLFAAAWAAYGMLGGGYVFLVVLVIAQIVVGGLLSVLHGHREECP